MNAQSTDNGTAWMHTQKMDHLHHKQSPKHVLLYNTIYFDHLNL